jgi:hypothetical protein
MLYVLAVQRYEKKMKCKGKRGFCKAKHLKMMRCGRSFPEQGNAAIPK